MTRATAERNSQNNILVVVLLVVAVVVVYYQASQGPWESWSRDGFWKADRGLADPAAVYADGEYQVFATSTTECIPDSCQSYWLPRYSGSSLNRPGALQGDAMPELPAWTDPNDRAIWAPSVAQIGGIYVVYFSATWGDAGIKCLGAGTSPTAVGPFVPQPAPLYCAAGFWSIDPYAVTDGASWFLLWRQDDPATPGGSIVGVPLSPDGLGLAGDPVTLLVGEYPWEDASPDEPGIGPVENPAMAQHPESGEWLLTWSANDWQTVQYATGLAVCQGPLGPCGRVSLDSPWLRTSSDPAISTSATFAGTGGLSFVTDPEGRRLYALFHAYRGTSDPVSSARVGWAYAVDHEDPGYSLQEF